MFFWGAEAAVVRRQRNGPQSRQQGCDVEEMTAEAAALGKVKELEGAEAAARAKTT